ncbi:MAG: class I SAM-dependent methyltransferase [Ginsengibacter sp.]
MTGLEKFPVTEELEVKIKSPLTNGHTTKIAEVAVNYIVQGYKKNFDIDVSDIFLGKNSVNIYRCDDSGYKFYYPYDIVGDSQFYKELEKFDWYYMPWKWEHEKSLNYISTAESILEVGCGSGFFLKTIRERYPTKKLTGLEINTDDTRDEYILNQTIQQHSSEGHGNYDLVCFYQVLEHISDVNSFLTASIKVLKKSGYLIISVPNNDTIFFKNKTDIFLNFPPHHMGLWSEGPLNYLTRQFDLKLVNKYYEPIPDYHFDWFKNIIKEKIRASKLPLSYRLSNNNFLMKRLYKILRKMYKGHSIMFVYKKL